ncbi:MAG: methyltransferase domain-containing protein [Chloroflexi bacterium]|jgi:ubiquinone/menaquinone biosynthesis C-methylase UbiE|nr:methyltransferase domain-containing protein [Chloroflexota bacterium]
MTVTDYSTVTELAGDDISREQVERMCHRYYWAATYCDGKDVIEAACGTGPGLGYLARRARSVRAGDITESILETARAHYGDRVELQQFDASHMPYGDQTADVIILFEALYYLPDAEQFMRECRRVLRDDGVVLIANANKDLFDFTPSPYSHTYHGAVELTGLFARHGFTTELSAYLSTATVSWRQKLLRPIKKLATDLHLMPSSMAGKKLLKQLMFGGLVAMPREITEGMAPYTPPSRIATDRPDTVHKVLYGAARKVRTTDA